MLHFAKIPKKMVNFGENSAKFGQIWANLRNFGGKTAKNSAICNGNFEIRERCKGVHCVDLGVSNEYLLAKFGFDTAENEPCKVFPRLSAYISPRLPSTGFA